ERRELRAAMVHHLARQGLTHRGRQRRWPRHAQVYLVVHHGQPPVVAWSCASSRAIVPARLFRAISDATRIPLRIALGPERPCPVRTTPFTPSTGAPPYSSKSRRWRTARTAGLTRAAPSLARSDLPSSARSMSKMIVPVPSAVFSSTLPAKPSAVTT